MNAAGLADLLRTAAALACQHGVEVRVSASGALVVRPLNAPAAPAPDKRAERNRRHYLARRLKASESVLKSADADGEKQAPLPLSPSLPLPPQTPPSPAHPHTPTPGHKRVREGTAGEDVEVEREEAGKDATQPQKPPAWTPDPGQKAVNQWFSRRDTTAWSKQEQKAWKAIPAAARADGLSALVAPYTASQGEAFRFRRRDLLTLLNHWQGEIDRWRHFKAPTQSDVRPLQNGYEDPPFLADEAAIFHSTPPHS